MRVMIVCHPCGPCREGRLHDVEGREKEEKRGSELGREEGMETATRERGRHKKKIIEQMLIHNRSPARSLISSSSHAPPLPSFPLLSRRLQYSFTCISTVHPTHLYSHSSLVLSWPVCTPKTCQMNSIYRITSPELSWMNSVPWRLLLNRN
jgi:hypothetical protein